jgi:predicted transposase/invertase (TIGR01784 family)
MDYEKHLSFLLYTMKHIHERDTILMLKEAMRRCSKAIIIDKEQNYVLTKLILWYTDSKVPEEKRQLLEQIIIDNLPKEEANNIMRTIADSYIEEGFNKGILQGTEKGIEKGKAELIKMMLNQGNPVDKIAKITGLSVSDIQKLI